MHDSIRSLIPIREVCTATCQGRSTLYTKIKEGDFPPPVRVGKRRVAWRSEDIQHWIDSRGFAVLGVQHGV